MKWGVDLSKYLPSSLAYSVFDIDYKSLYNYGKRIIIFDLDNTLISYRETLPNDKLIALGQELLDMGFKTYVLTNNHEKRIKPFIEKFPCTGYSIHMNKPSEKRMFRFLVKNNIANLIDIVMIGDQLVTDMLCANRLGVYGILVKSKDRSSEHFYTRINRLREKRIVKKIAVDDIQYARKIEKIVNKGDKEWLNA